ncbi:TMV resistance protein N-like [Ziziphus jujuba]|uniref:ADP-ribosyl cyclase/cyclic ADP-ribose hydrolase n=1 Tax=Ziziphus jujuba TaxID=326968 RepID=A0ABM4ABU2_ZIZJJ|nr:TMV resistance protein N-like [Ziziphus jujuba]
MTSSSSSLSLDEKYDVFLSFRGEDTRDTFTSYLYAALSAKQVSTFMDHELERGDEISPTLSKAIEESKISVIIFSKNYASSTWCLDELVQILECKERRGQVVMPIFYGIDPSDVRKQKGSYKIAFSEHEKRFHDRMGMVNQWRAALTEASNLCGLDSKDFRPENKLVQKLIEDISKKLPKYLSSNMHINGHLIGIEKKIKEIESKLCTGIKDVRIIGIWGMGGIGKTTLASAVFQRLSYFQFESYCFLWNIREEYLRCGPNYLRKKLLSELLSDESILRMDTPFVASPFIHDKLSRKKVLIVLDDVDSSTHLEALVEGYDHFAPGSRIIVTTRNVQVLIKKEADDIYKLEGLNKNESFELFSLHAFGNSFPSKDYELLLNRATSYADGNPLALKVLGSFLRSKSTDEWESALNKLKTIPNKDILDVLRISYEGLDDKEVKNLFLDIACLLNQSFTRDDVENMLDAGHSFVKIGLTVLIEKSLIESHEDNKLWMHDLLRQVGRAIVLDEHREPSNRSRLWDVRDVCHVFERNTGTAAVEGISFNMAEISKDVKLCHAAFSEMYNLRILKIHCDNIDENKFKLYIPQGLGSYLSDKLTYLRWDLYPLESLPSKFSPENLVELVLRGSHIQKLWNYHEVKSLPILRRIDLSYSKFLTQIQNLSLAPNLESINLEGCKSLVHVLSSLQNLYKLTYLNLSGCSKLRDFEEISKTTEEYLDVARLGGTKNLLINFTFLRSCIRSFMGNFCLYSSKGHISQKFAPNLKCLLLSETAIETVPPSIGHLSGLVELNLSYCTRLKSLPSSICHLKSLESLVLSGCKELKTFPEILEPMEHLRTFWLDESGIKELPESIENLVSLKELYIHRCTNLEFLPNRLRKLRNLETIALDHCSKFQKLPSLPPSLLYLSLNYCEKLESLPELPSLCLELYAKYCTSLEKILKWRAPLLDNLGIDVTGSKGDTLQTFDFYGCENLDQNTCNTMLANLAVIQILSRLKFVTDGTDYINVLVLRHPGDEIPKWFSYQTCGTSINNIMLPPYWNNDDLLALAFCIVLRRNIIDHGIDFYIHSELNLKTIDDGRLYKYHDYSWWISENNVRSDHVLIWYVEKRSLQYSECNKFSKEMDGLNWPSTCSTEASFHVRPFFIDSSEQALDIRSDQARHEYAEIKKFGVRFVYKQDMERCDAETERKNKRHFNECCESSGSEAVDSLEEEDDDHESHSKKLKVI